MNAPVRSRTPIARSFSNALKNAALTSLALIGMMSSAQAGVVEFKQNQLYVDGEAQPQLFGGEVQYFRLRGGEGRNVPRAKVIDLWNKALDRAVEAKFNTISFYIPWDFHEYAEGKFDFDGTVDEDGDGNPDYPSRDVHTFIKMAKAKGIKNIHVRPGPYINAEWGFLGFGAVPMWFNDKFPNSHARDPKGRRTLLYSYTDPDFRRYSKIWLTKVYQEVIKDNIGPGGLFTFLQLDNETNFMWQSAFNHDYGTRAIGLYRDFLKVSYGGDLAKVNAAHARTWADWKDIKAPSEPGKNIGEDQDWYRFQDETMHQYLHWVRTVWEGLGVREPNVLFTLAESYNAAEHGILPNYKFRNDPGYTGMMGVNLYPKTYDTPDHTLMNLPFKADHDTKAADSAHANYLGHREEWVMGPEIQAGWWKGTPVSIESRQQTYLTTLGHGMKAIFVYYFNEGNNWQQTWTRDQVRPFYDALHSKPEYKAIVMEQLPDAFWTRLDKIIARKLFVGITAKWALINGGTQPTDLYFDAPLNKDAEPNKPYAALKEFGEKVVAPYGKFLGSATELTDDVCLLKDDRAHVPSPVPGLSSRIITSDWDGGLLALLFQAGINPRIIHFDINPASELQSCKMVVYQDNGFATPELAAALQPVLARGGGVVNFLYGGLTGLLTSTPAGTVPQTCTRLPATPMEVDGFRCSVGGGLVYQARVPIYDVFNTDTYANVSDVPARRQVVQNILDDLHIVGNLNLVGGGDRVVAYARAGADGKTFWVTAKSGRLDTYTNRIQFRAGVGTSTYQITDVFSGAITQMTGEELAKTGFPITLKPNGSTAFYITPVAVTASK